MYFVLHAPIVILCLLGYKYFILKGHETVFCFRLNIFTSKILNSLLSLDCESWYTLVNSFKFWRHALIYVTGICSMSTNQVKHILPLVIKFCDKNPLDMAIKLCDLRALDKKIEFYGWKTWFFAIAIKMFNSQIWKTQLIFDQNLSFTSKYLVFRSKY